MVRGLPLLIFNWSWSEKELSLERATQSKNVVRSLFLPDPKWLSSTKNSKCSREKEKARGDKYMPKIRRSAGVMYSMHIC